MVLPLGPWRGGPSARPVAGFNPNQLNGPPPRAMAGGECSRIAEQDFGILYLQYAAHVDQRVWPLSALSWPDMRLGNLPVVHSPAGLAHDDQRQPIARHTDSRRD